jgi:hypothetical protein
LSDTNLKQQQQQLEMHKEKTREELIDMYVRIQYRRPGAPDPSEAKVELNEVLAKCEASMHGRKVSSQFCFGLTN